MTQRSRFWEGITTGDALAEAPYDGSTEFAQVLMAAAGTTALTDKSAVVRSVLNALAPTVSGANVLVNTGEAFVYGSWYQNDASVSTAIPTPSSATRVDRIVLRKDWTAETVRVTRVAGVEGGSAPALVQTIGVTWDFPIAQASTTTGGVITLTDQRVFTNPLVSTPVTVAQGGTGDTTLTAHGVLLGNGTSAIAATAAGGAALPLVGGGGSADPTFVALTSTGIAAGAVDTTQLASSAVTAAKIADGTITPGKLSATNRQVSSGSATFSGGTLTFNDSGSVSVSFSPTMSSGPFVFVNFANSGTGAAGANTASTTGVTLQGFSTSISNPAVLQYMAVTS